MLSSCVIAASDAARLVRVLVVDAVVVVVVVVVVAVSLCAASSTSLWMHAPPIKRFPSSLV